MQRVSSSFSVQLLRSVLFCPGNKPKVVAKALALNADAVILDWEDAVAVSEKAAARHATLSLLSVATRGRCVGIRINDPSSREGLLDVRAVSEALQVNPSICDVIVIPKMESPDTALRVRDSFHLPLWAMVETALGVLHAPAIAACDPVHCLVLGANDLLKSLGGRSTPSRTALLHGMSQCVYSARAYGKKALDGVHNAVADESGLMAQCQQARDMGFDGKTLIHPSQIEIANGVFSPAPEEVQAATRILQAWKGAGQDAGVVTVDGKMVEELHVAEARKLLQLHQIILQRGQPA